MDIAPKIAAKVFVSYARQDCSTLAEELVTALELLQFDGYLDRSDIAAGEDWEHRLDALIRQADTVVFVLSPRSVQSERCAWEVQRALALSKRIIPVVGMPVDDASVPAPLQRLNYIHFTAGHSFARALGQLADALRLDIGWIREHTRLGELALRWHDRQQPEALLLRGDELSAGQAWMANWAPEFPPVTELQRSFIAASADAQTRRESLERQQNEAIAKANAERAEALTRREEALVSLKRRTVLGGVLAVGLSLGLGGMAWWTLQLRRRAEEAERNAIDELVRREAMRTDITGQIVAYATSPGQWAMDSGVDGHSPYTGTLLRELQAPDISLWVALSRTTTQVAKATNGSQRPFISSDMNGDVFLGRPSPTRRLRALVIAAGRFGSGPDLVLEGVYKDADAWGAFLAGRGFSVQTLRDPTRASVLASIEALRVFAADEAAASIRRSGIALNADGPQPQPSLPAPGPNRSEAAPAHDALIVFFYAGYGFRTGADRFLAVSDTIFDSAKPGLAAEPGATAVSVGELEKVLRDAAAASVVILDTNFI